jgi:hypothetical protein
MVLPSSPPEAPPQILLEQNGVWRDMMPADQTTNVQDIQKTKRDIDAYFGKIMGEVEGGTAHTADSATLRLPFAGFYKKLVTSRVRELLLTAAETRQGDDLPELRIHAHTYVEWLPWEMFHDGKDFLGLRFRVARLPITTQVPNVSAKQVTVQKVYNLLATNFLDDAQRARWDQTFDGVLPAGHETRFPPPPPSIDNVFNARDADILHITCHGGFRDQDDNVYWTLDSTSAQPLNYEIKTTQFDLEGLGYDTTPLVFGNACASTDSGGGTRKNGLIPSYGAAFFASGALNFVGTFAPITKDLAVDFAGLFYQKLLGAGGGQPLPIAQALWATKNHYRSAAVNSPDPSYLFYCLYGPPDTVFRP